MDKKLFDKIITKRIAIHGIMDHYVKTTKKMIDSDYSTALNFMLLQSIVNPTKRKEIIKILSEFLSDESTLKNIGNIDLEFYKKNLKNFRTHARKRNKIRH
jgi:hypothetical protein